MNIWQNNNNKMQFTLFLIGNWNQEGVEASLAWRLENAHITLNMLQNRCPFLYNSSAFLLSFLCIVLISFYPGTLSLEPFPIFYGVIASYYTKRKWQWRQGYLFCFESHHFDKKNVSCHLLIFLLLIWRVHLIRSCLVWMEKFFYCDWQINGLIFSNVIRLQLSPNR